MRDKCRTLRLLPCCTLQRQNMDIRPKAVHFNSECELVQLRHVQVSQRRGHQGQDSQRQFSKLAVLLPHH